MRRFLVVWYFLFQTSISHSQTADAVQNQYQFNYLSVDQGLSSNNVRSICQDSKGLIWLGTLNGVDKFDGQTIVSYRYDQNDSTTISSNRINSVFLDSKDNLWVSSNGGLDLYNADYNNFIRFKHKDINWPLGSIDAIAEDKGGNLWFGGVSGLYSYNLNTSKIQYFSNKANNKYGIPPNIIYRLLVDKNNNLWISIQNEGLCVYNQNASTFNFFRNNPNDASTISGNRIEILYEDSKGTIWAGTMNNGLNRYIPESKSFISSIPDPNNSFSTRVRAIFEDLKGNFFVGTRSGLYIYNTHENKFTLYAHEGHNFSNLSQNSITVSYIDKTGTLWIGTFSGGVNYTNLFKKEFIHYLAGKNDNQFLNGSNIYAITEDPEGNLWIGGDNGLNFLNRTSHTFSYYTNIPDDPNSLSYNDIKALDWDEKGNLWVGTNRGGLNYFNVKTGKFKSYRHNPDNPKSIIGDKIYGLMNDKDNNLWILTTPINNYQFLNIDILPNGSDKFIHLNEQAYLGLDQDEKGNVYIGGVNGFWIFSGKDSLFSFISNDSLIDQVNTIRKDSQDNLWIGSTLGLVRYNPKDKSFNRYSEENGYPISEVLGILEDDSKNLWVSTNLGLIKISNIIEDTNNIKFRVFDHFDGLQSKQFNYNAYYKCESGEMAFGGINGFNTFFPDKIVENKVPADVIITDLKIFNTTVPIGEKVGGRIILEKSIAVTDRIKLGPQHTIFTLEFASLQNANPERNTFKFKLEGLDKDWQFRKARNNFATYTNLSAGVYTFIITVSNSDGVWNDEPVELEIVIIPPFYRSWWFRVLSGLSLLGLFFGIYFYRARSIRIRNQILERTVKQRTAEISKTNQMLVEANFLLEEKQEEIGSQNEELEKHRNNLESLVKDRTQKLEEALVNARKADELKSAFLANMSHEIRTPMNAITGFSALLNELDSTPEERSKFIEIIESNSKSLLKIIDEILDLSMIQSNQLRLTTETVELNIIIDHLYSYYYLSNNNHQVEIRKNNTLRNLNLNLKSDSVRIRQILTNLMDNACKFTQEGFIEIGTKINKKDLCIYVKDTGRGIPSDKTDQIFQQFTKLEDDESEWTQGLGLGLAISQKIANALGGTISVESEPNKGSKFTFRIPLDDVPPPKKNVAEDIKESLRKKWEGKTILIAEDVEANYQYLGNILKNTKTTILWARNGVDALALAIENPNIDLILMDIKMPKMDGYEAAKKIKEHNPKLKIIAQTAYARPEEKAKFYDENFDEYLSKPIKPAELTEMLEKFL